MDYLISSLMNVSYCNIQQQKALSKLNGVNSVHLNYKLAVINKVIILINEFYFEKTIS